MRTECFASRSQKPRPPRPARSRSPRESASPETRHGVSIQFLGGAGTVTGSKFLVRKTVGETARRILVDCGLFQGLKELRLQNWAPFPVDPARIDDVILTHAHIDHSGYLPLLVRNGFRGRIHCTPPTRDLARILLLDSAKIQEEDAETANRERFSKHSPALPLYTIEDAERCLAFFSPFEGTRWQDLGQGVRFRFTPSGHILGSAFVELDCHGTRIVFSGDLGRRNPLMLAPPSVVERADFLVLESTYGDRDHSTESPLAGLARIVSETVARGGHLTIPSFAVGRTQDLLWLFTQLKRQHKIPDVPIFLDSPMGINATEILVANAEWHKIAGDDIRALCRVATMVRGQQQSLDLLKHRPTTVVLAGSGMVGGGRVLRHLEKRLPDERNTVLLVGFQAAGTRGSQLWKGAPEVKMLGHYVPVRARIEMLSSLSAHADQSETLHWLRGFKAAPRRTFIVHGEPEASDALRVKIGDTLGWRCHVPQPMEEVALDRDAD